MGQFFQRIKDGIKNDWQRNKKELSEIKTEARKWKDETKHDFSELKKELSSRPSLKETMAEAKKNRPKGQTLREAFREDKEKRKRKEAEYNPSTFTRITTAASIAFTTIIAIMLIPTIVGIPISALIFGMNVWAWRKYVTKKPEPTGNQREIEALHKRIEELERGKSEGSY